MRGACIKAARRLDIRGARSVAASYKPPMLVTRARLPACAFGATPPELLCLQMRLFEQARRLGAGASDSDKDSLAERSKAGAQGAIP